MKGSNTLELNEATMIEAVQFWLNSQFVEGKAPVVKSVTGGTGTYDNMFKVSVEETHTDKT